MIAALKTEKFNLALELKTKYGIPQYVIDTYKEDDLARMIRLIPENPWTFYDKESGFSIKLCETLADKFNVNNNLEKCKAYLKYSIDRTAEQGHCYAKEWQIDSIIKNHNFTAYEKQKAIDNLQREGDLFVSKSNNYFLSKYFNAEKDFANLLINLNRDNGYFTGFKKEYSFMYDELNNLQKSVVDAVEFNRLIIFSGLPGTGKTTTIRAIVDCYGQDNVVLLAPTGKAANRMSELCGIHASTLHSFFFNPNGYNKIVENQIIIIDETSMCDAEVVGWVGNSIGDGCVLILVGDPDQLPSVGPGQILQDVLDSGIGFTIHLNEIMRQKPGSIIKSAHAIHNGKNILCGNDNEVITFYPSNWNLQKITEKICKHPEWRNAQLLSVLKQNGSQIINQVAQNILNPHTHIGFRVGDKVIHTKNNKDLGVFNGEMGIVNRITDKTISVTFKDKRINYPIFMSWQLELAYCITTHKSQGSEFEKVVFFVNQSQITTRNLIYTALTRAKNKILIIAPSEQVLLDGIENKQKPRQTSLSWLIKKEL